MSTTQPNLSWRGYEVSQIDELLNGSWTENEHGRCFIARQSYNLSYIHGQGALSDFLTIQPSALSDLCRDPALAGADLSSALFLDTETTGLDRGAGTLVFLVGVGFFRENAFEVLQFFLHAPEHERAMLCALQELLREFPLIVTFNGKSFDVPMLEHRFARSSLPCDFTRLLHADLLTPSRRLWKERLMSCRLTSLERNILGLSRVGDVRGDQIPGLYLSYVEDGDPYRLLPVFHHNVQDILTLLAITSCAAAVFADPFSGRVDSGLDFLSLGRAYEAIGQHDKALMAYSKALSLPLCPSARAQLCRRIIPLYKQRSHLKSALAFWEEMVSSGSSYCCVYPYEELAKHYEHETGQYAEAEALTLRALELLPYDYCTHTSRQKLEKRLRRVRQKLESERGE